MRTRWFIPALLAVVVIAVAAFVTLRPATTVSAQEILKRASAAQSAAASAQGIAHYRIEIYENPQALAGVQAGTTTISETYAASDGAHYRFVKTDLTGKVIEASSLDGAYQYSSKPGDTTSPLPVHRAPANAESIKPVAVGERTASEHAVFDQFSGNPRVEVEGQVTWMDGSPAYVLVNRSYQTEKQADGKETQVLTGATKMIFNAQSYALLESQTTVRQNGQDVMLSSSKFLVDEILPTGSPVTWDISDLKGIAIIDEAARNSQASDPGFATLTQAELAARAPHAYLLKTIPAGYTLEIVAANDQPKDQPYAYELHYHGPDKQSFEMQYVDVMDPAFVRQSFYDGSYKAANGMVLAYSPSGSSAMLTTPQGTSYLVFFKMPRERVQALVEDLAPIQ